MPTQAYPAVRVAHCIVGGARGLPRREVYGSLRTIADTLADNSTGADIFLNLQLTESDDSSKSSGTRTNRFTIDDLGRALRTLQPVAIDFSDRHGLAAYHRTPGCTNGNLSGPVCMQGTEYSCKFWAQVTRWHACYEMVQEYEKKHNIRYDWSARLSLAHFTHPPHAARCMHAFCA
eukprot:1333965-Prymnesium_polylepis.2